MNHASIQTPPCGEIIITYIHAVIESKYFKYKTYNSEKGTEFTSSTIKIASVMTLEQILYLVDDRSFYQTDPNKEFENYV